MDERGGARLGKRRVEEIRGWGRGRKRLGNRKAEVGEEEVTPISLIMVDSTPAVVLKMVREVIL